MNNETLKPGIINLNLLPEQWGLVACGRKKQPYQKAWQKNPLNKDQVGAEVKASRCHAVGVLCGTPSGGLLFVDHDGPSCTALIEQLSGESVDNALPSTLVISSGRAGRAQYVYRVPEMFWGGIQTHKVPTGAFGEDGKPEQLEFRWDGCQSIVMGAHPATAGYKWLYDAESITTAPLWMIEQMLVSQQVSESVSVSQSVADEPKSRQGSSASSSVSQSAKSYKEYSDIDWAQEYLAAIPATADYDTWLHVGMALHSVSPDLLEEWESWSKGATNYDAKACAYRWARFERSGRSLGTLGYLAKKNGWAPLVSKSVTVGQEDSDKLKTRQGKDSGSSVSQSVKSKDDISEKDTEESLITDQEWARFRQAMTSPGSFDPFLWLPERLAKMARSDAARNSIDPMAIWAYLLPATLSMMGRDTWLDMSGYRVPNIAWSLLIGDSGTGKSRAKNLVMRPIEKWNIEEFENWKLRVDDWAQQEKAKAKDKSDDSTPNPKPKCRRWMVAQSTPEGVVRRLADQENNGMVWVRDEVAGLFKGLTQYSKDSDGPEMLLESWDGGAIMVDRADEDRSFAVESSRMSLAGGIQLKIFSKIFETKEDANGTLGRSLCVVPARIPYKRFKGASVLPVELAKVYQFIDSVDWGTITPTTEADDLFTEVAEDFLNQKPPSGNVEPWLLKLPGHTLRLAMAIHAIECYYDRSKATQTLTSDTMARAYHMAQHYQRHFYYLMGASASDGVEGILAKIQEVACCSGEGITPRDVARGPAGSRVDKMARAEGMKPAAFCLTLFHELADNGWGEVREAITSNGRKRVTYHAFENHCSKSTDQLTDDAQIPEHQGLRLVSEPLTDADQSIDQPPDTSLKDTRNKGFENVSNENGFTDQSNNGEVEHSIPISQNQSPPHSTNGNGSTNGYPQNGSAPPDYTGLNPDNFKDYGFEEF